MSSYRAGSTLLARSLNQHPSLLVGEELFNVNNLARDQQLLTAPLLSVRRFFEHSGDARTRAVGFKLMYQQATGAELDRAYWFPGPSRPISRAIDAIEARIEADRRRYLDDLEEVWNGFRRDLALQVIHLTRRHYLASYVSFVLALTDDRWVSSPYKTRSIQVDPERCRSWFESREALFRYYAELFASHPVLPIAYEDLSANLDSTVREVLRFLDVDPMRLVPATAKQQTRPLRAVVENYEELSRHFESTRWRDQFRMEGDM